MSAPDTGPLHLRAGGLCDADTLAALERAAFGDRRWPDGAIATSLTQPHVSVCIAETHGVAKGFLVWRRLGDEGEILTLGITPEARRQGLANRLLHHLEASARADGLQRLLLDVSADNGPALALYAGHGYQECARRVRYYRDGSHALVLEKPLGDTTGPL